MTVALVVELMAFMVVVKDRDVLWDFVGPRLTFDMVM